jgi:hypothetical protein
MSKHFHIIRSTDEATDESNIYSHLRKYTPTYDAIAQRPGDFLNKIFVLSSIFSCGISRIPLLNVMSNSEFFPGFLNFTPD